jgi:DNA repair photolyase
MLITPFDPWKSKLCTCPQKLTLNPYTGCSHQCIYCYVSSYIPNFFHVRPKKNLIPRLKKEAAQLKGELISISNSSDPYPHIEETLGLTRACLRVLIKHDCKLQIITKSTLVTRDIDLLKKTPSMVSITITTENDKIAKTLEPFAPPPSKRLNALKKLIQNGIPVSARIDPVIPYLNTDPAQLVKKLVSIGVLHITCSTYKVKPDNWKRFRQAFPTLAKSLQPLYFEKGERIGRSFYLPKEMRQKIIKKIKELVEREGAKFSSCREGFPQLNSATCDGSWLIRES